jgi:hypothetical protein
MTMSTKPANEAMKCLQCGGLTDGHAYCAKCWDGMEAPRNRYPLDYTLAMGGSEPDEQPHPAAPADAGDAMRVALEKIASMEPYQHSETCCQMHRIANEALAAARRLLDAPPGVGERAKAVADTLLERRDIDREIIYGRRSELPTNTPYWNDLMRRERDARVANDAALAAYRSGSRRPRAGRACNANGGE